MRTNRLGGSAVRAAGYDDAQAIAIVLQIAWTYYINEVGKTKIDFPRVVAHKTN
jgi:hypothetical protein